MRDIDVRISLLKNVYSEFSDDTGTMVIEEFIAGDSRVDLAVVNGALHGYEIKSDSDTLGRLPAQITSYNSVFDYITLVAGGRHLSEAGNACPTWWGIMSATDTGNGVDLVAIREPYRNPNPDPVSIAWLLWRDEAIALLEDYGVRGVRRRTRGQLASIIAMSIPIPELQSRVRNQLRARSNWRPDAARM